MADQPPATVSELDALLENCMEIVQPQAGGVAGQRGWRVGRTEVRVRYGRTPSPSPPERVLNVGCTFVEIIRHRNRVSHRCLPFGNMSAGVLLPHIAGKPNGQLALISHGQLAERLQFSSTVSHVCEAG